MTVTTMASHEEEAGSDLLSDEEVFSETSKKAAKPASRRYIRRQNEAASGAYFVPGAVLPSGITFCSWSAQ